MNTSQVYALMRAHNAIPKLKRRIAAIEAIPEDERTPSQKCDLNRCRLSLWEKEERLGY